MHKGKLIVLYGINNLGKTTQAKKIVAWLGSKGFKAEHIKYPLYDLEPSGPYINAIVRKNVWKKISPEEIQLWYALNRFQYQPELRRKLEQGIMIVAEDYVGTGIAWGVAEGVNEEWLEQLNAPLYPEDVSILLFGKRFLHAAEKNHFHESNALLMEHCHAIHEKLAKDRGWVRIAANQPVELVHTNMIRAIEKKLNLYV
jgi:dTMP kinase